ncbi:L-serine ammonia-lyase, iron-sulfur-dependent, subunit beta [Agathobacter sp.]
MAFSSIADIEKYMKEHGCHFYEAILHEEARDSLSDEKTVFNKMTSMYRIMKEADQSYESRLKSHSGLSGGNGAKMQEYADKCGGHRADINTTAQCAFCGEFGSHVMATAIKMAESNACMKRIVASPTAGSCGVVPAILINYERFFAKMDMPKRDTQKADEIQQEAVESRMTEALLVAAGIGNVIANRASISGAAGGCQAEIGTSSAMAAGALAYLRGGDEYIANAAALALKNLLGLACDPVAGLVEVPCVKRNASGAMNALCAVDMALAGIESAIPADEVFDAMREIGDLMSRELKETGKGGLAVTPTACRVHL